MGSEMCIRDRDKAVGSGYVTERCGTVSRVQAVPFGLGWSRSVKAVPVRYGQARSVKSVDTSQVRVR